MECVVYVKNYWRDVTGKDLPTSGSSSTQFWENAEQRSGTKKSIHTPSIVVWDRNDGGEYGHVAIVSSKSGDLYHLMDANRYYDGAIREDDLTLDEIIYMFETLTYRGCIYN